MAWKEKPVEKLYYTITEVAKMLNINASMLRYWEREFDMLKPKKNGKGDRFYTKEEIATIKLIYHLVKEKGYTLEGARARLKTDLKDVKVKAELTEKLKNLRSFLEHLKEELS